mmetsp:Transcript_53108/g.151314  ORF Transcript_53108/g.151314 Transcript_53108/m.151314 type:complete len:306 (+) Transcript_53108:61-978(+)
MGQRCDKVDTDGDLEMVLDNPVNVVLADVGHRHRLLHTDSIEALHAPTNPFKYDLRWGKPGTRSAAGEGPDAPASASQASTNPFGSEASSEAEDEGAGPHRGPSIAPRGGAPARAAAGADACGGIARQGVTLRHSEGHPSVRALAFPYQDAPVLGEILNAEQATLVSECGEFLQVSWKGLKVWISRSDATAPQALRTDASEMSFDRAIDCSDLADVIPTDGYVFSVGETVDIYVHEWVPAQVTGILGSGLVQVRNIASTATQAAENGVEAQCGIWLDRQQQQGMLRPRARSAMAKPSREYSLVSK